MIIDKNIEATAKIKINQLFFNKLIKINPSQHLDCNSTIIIEYANMVDKMLPQFISTYTLPEEHDENFNIGLSIATLFHTTSWQRNCWNRALSARNKQDPFKYSSNSVSYENNIQLIESQGVERMEEKEQKISVQKTIESLMNEFSCYLTTYEADLFKGMRLNHSSVELYNTLKKKYTGVTLDNLKYARKTLDFRLILHLASSDQDVFTDSYVIKQLNSQAGYRKRLKKYFKIDNLIELPSQEDMRYVVTGKAFRTKNKSLAKTLELRPQVQDVLAAARAYDPEGKISGEGSKSLYQSKKDFTGKIHKKYVVFINYVGQAYDFTTQENKSII